MHLNAEQIKARGEKVMGYFLARRQRVGREAQTEPLHQLS